MKIPHLDSFIKRWHKMNEAVHPTTQPLKVQSPKQPAPAMLNLAVATPRTADIEEAQSSDTGHRYGKIWLGLAVISNSLPLLSRFIYTQWSGTPITGALPKTPKYVESRYTGLSTYRTACSCSKHSTKELMSCQSGISVEDMISPRIDPCVQ
jgi:hypothetical protein